MGRPKQERPVDGNLAREIKAKINAKAKWIRVVEIASEKAEKTGNTADLRSALIYLDNRDLGDCVQPVNHLHDQPIQHEVTIAISQVVREVRERKQNYERSRA